MSFVARELHVPQWCDGAPNFGEEHVTPPRCSVVRELPVAAVLLFRAMWPHGWALLYNAVIMVQQAQGGGLANLRYFVGEA